MHFPFSYIYQRWCLYKCKYLVVIVVYCLCFLLPLYWLASFRFIALGDNSKEQEWGVQAGFVAPAIPQLPAEITKNLSYSSMSKDFCPAANISVNIYSSSRIKLADSQSKQNTQKKTDPNSELPLCKVSFQLAEELNLRPGDTLELAKQSFTIVDLLYEINPNSVRVDWPVFLAIYPEKSNYYSLSVSASSEAEEQQLAEQLHSLLTVEEVEFLSVSSISELNQEQHKDTNFWLSQRAGAIVLALVFFALNQLIILIDKWQKDRVVWAVHRAVGASKKTVWFIQLIETLTLATIAYIVAICSLKLVLEFNSLTVVTRLDIWTIAVGYLILMPLCLLLQMLVIGTLKRPVLATLLKEGIL